MDSRLQAQQRLVDEALSRGCPVTPGESPSWPIRPPNTSPAGPLESALDLVRSGRAEGKVRWMVTRWITGSATTAAVAVLMLVSGCASLNNTASGGGTLAGASESPAAGQPVAPLTKAQLAAALLTAKDLPAGYKIDSTNSGSPTDDMTGDASCQKMNAIDSALRKGTRPAQVAYADVSYTRTDTIGGGDESLSSFRTEQAAWREFSQYAVAANNCRSLRLQADATTAIALSGKLLSLPPVGDQSRAYQYVGTVQGTTFWMDAMVFRVGSTVAMVTAGGFGGKPQPQLLTQIAYIAAGKLT